jgi:hypothetical protein
MKRTTAAHSVGGLHVDKVLGVTIGTTGIAEDRNNWQEEIASLIEGTGQALDGADWMQLEKAIQVGRVGEVVEFTYEVAPVTWQNARNKTYPGNPRYMPMLAVWDADHDVDSAQAPLLVPAMRAFKAKASNGSGGWVTDHSVTVAAHVCTGSGTAWDNLLAALAEEELVDVAMGKGGFTAWRCLNVGGTDYAITGVSTAGHTATITGDSLSGAQTAIWYPHRIAAQATKIRLFQQSGEATVAHGTSECIGGGRRRDRGQGHYHSPLSPGVQFPSSVVSGGSYQGPAGGTTQVFGNTTGAPATDGTNGTPRTGPTTDPRATVVFRYLNAGVLLN